MPGWPGARLAGDGKATPDHGQPRRGDADRLEDTRDPMSGRIVSWVIDSTCFDPGSGVLSIRRSTSSPDL
jgi:hypothetical protein